MSAFKEGDRVRTPDRLPWQGVGVVTGTGRDKVFVVWDKLPATELTYLPEQLVKVPLTVTLDNLHNRDLWAVVFRSTDVGKFFQSGNHTQKSGALRDVRPNNGAVGVVRLVPETRPDGTLILHTVDEDQP